MKENDLRVLISINDRLTAEDIKGFLEDSEIYTLLMSDHPASSVFSAYTGLNLSERIDIHVNVNDYQSAIDILKKSAYKDLFE